MLIGTYKYVNLLITSEYGEKKHQSLKLISFNTFQLVTFTVLKYNVFYNRIK